MKDLTLHAVRHFSFIQLFPGLLIFGEFYSRSKPCVVVA